MIKVRMVKPKLLDQVRYAARVRYLSYRTEQAYVDWIKRFILFHDKRYPSEMDEAHVSEFLTFPAVKRHVAASTQNQALSAILFLYRDMLKRELGWVENVERAKKPERLPERWRSGVKVFGSLHPLLSLAHPLVPRDTKRHI